MIDISKLSARFQVRRMDDADADEILALCRQNTQYYRYCGKRPSRELIISDLHLTPPDMPASAKYYVGFYDGSVLAAVMDLIEGYPDEDAAFIGFFMMNRAYQGRQIGSGIVREVCEYLKKTGMKTVRLGIDKGNPQSTHFWKKNGFRVIKELAQDGWTVQVAEKTLDSDRENDSVPSCPEERMSPDAAAGELQLYIPRMGDGWFYQKMMSDPATMAYNAPWFPPDGCIPNPEEEWAALCENWIGREPDRFYAFLRRISDVNFHRSPAGDWWDMGIVIYAPERGRGYGREGVQLLADRAFRVAGISCLHNDFETARGAAYHIHRAAGFRETGRENGIIHLELRREDYLSCGDAGEQTAEK